MGFGDTAVFLFVIVVFHEDFFDPGVYGKGANLVKPKEADAVCHLFSNSIKTGQVFHGLPVCHLLKGLQIQGAG